MHSFFSALCDSGFGECVERSPICECMDSVVICAAGVSTAVVCGTIFDGTIRGTPCTGSSHVVSSLLFHQYHACRERRAPFSFQALLPLSAQRLGGAARGTVRLGSGVRTPCL